MKLINISKTYHNKHSDVTALKSLNLEINQIGITAIIGPSGCGKTTLLHILSGREKDFEGERIVQGSIEVIEQDIMLFEKMSVLDNLKIISDDTKETERLLTHFQMEEHKGKKVKNLSIGQKKRVQIIRSLLNHPDYLLCDEPTASLDYENAEIVMQMLREISQEISVIVVTHDRAVVDHYADQIIKMQKGSIESFEIKNEKRQFVPADQASEKKSVKKHLYLFQKMIGSRIGETLFLFVLVFLMCISLFGSSLFQSVNQTMDDKGKWRTGENVITSQPNKGNNVFRDTIEESDIEELEYSSGSFYYDLYSADDIQFVKDNVKEVIGYRCGWNIHLYSQHGTWLPRIYYDRMIELVKQAESEVAKTGRSYTEYELYLKNRVEMMSEEERKNPSKYYATDFRNQEKINDHTEVYLEDEFLKLEPFSPEEQVTFYQIFNEYQLPVRYGRWMENDQEIVVPYNVALQIQELNSLSSPEDIIGQAYSVYLPKNTLGEPSDEDKVKKVCSFTVVGITYYGHEDEKQIFMREGVWDKLRSDFYEFQDDVQYQYVDFIVEENADAKTVAEKIDGLLESKESHFVTKSGSKIIKEDYQNASVFRIFVWSVCLGMIILLIISHIIVQKRERKELALMRIYGYQPLLITLWKVIGIFVVVGALQIICLPFIRESLNTFASSLGFAYMLSQDMRGYLLAWSISLILVLLIEIFFQRKRNGGE